MSYENINPNSLQVLFPDIVKEWHPIKNNGLDPNHISKSSAIKAWWVCPKGHEYYAAISNRTANNSGCPYCRGRKVCKDNCIATLFPKLTKEWNYNKNTNLTPNDVSKGSHKKVWWTCPKLHDYQATILSRTSGSNCPYCSNNKVCKENSVASIYPEIAKEWHPTQNYPLIPSKITKRSSKIVWWICSKGHEYEAAISSRTNGRGCPYCSGKRACKENSLANIFPIIAKEWHPTKNDSITPFDITKGSSKKAWWICPQGHEYQAVICNRTNNKTQCPYCTGRKACKDNSITNLYPEVVKEWDYNKNKNLSPDDVTKGSHKKVWWICPKKHEYQMSVKCRTNGYLCPYCSNKQVCYDNCLAINVPKITKEWHPTKNIPLSPYDFTKGSSKNIWWLCPKKHEYKATISARTSGNGCPYCAGKRACIENSLATLYPELAKEWHPSKNTKMSPSQITPGSVKKAWWLCPKGHEYYTSVLSRSHGSNCPYCTGRRACADNCLSTLFPKIAKEWHPDKNDNLTPADVTKGSHKKIWWLCPKGHTYQAKVLARTTGNNCRFCSNQTSRPEIRILTELL